jgi:nicotinamide mononucleotide (NMN) deamidase PncC
MDAARRQLIEAIHNAPPLAVLALTGGGATAAAELLAVPGASRTVLELVVPYDEHALCQFLGRRPEQFCSTETAVAMAEAALARARCHAPGQPIIGLGCTASLATDRPKRGDHRFHVAAATEAGTTAQALTLKKGARDREAEEAVLDTVILNQLAEAMGIAERLPVALLADEQLVTDRQPASSPLIDLLAGKVPAVGVEVDGRMRTTGPRPTLVLPGSFNPLHEGHRKLAACAAGMVQREPAFELSVLNVEKPTLTAEAVRQRLPQFTWYAPVWLTQAPLITQKADVFPGAVFVVGADTAERLVEPRFYEGSHERMLAALAHIRNQGCRFLVAGRLDADGRFRQLSDLPIPADFADLFTPIPAEMCRVDLSSTALRASR